MHIQKLRSEYAVGKFHVYMLILIRTGIIDIKAKQYFFLAPAGSRKQRAGSLVDKVFYKIYLSGVAQSFPKPLKDMKVSYWYPSPPYPHLTNNTTSSHIAPIQGSQSFIIYIEKLGCLANPNGTIKYIHYKRKKWIVFITLTRLHIIIQCLELLTGNG